MPESRARGCRRCVFQTRPCRRNDRRPYSVRSGRKLLFVPRKGRRAQGRP